MAAKSKTPKPKFQTKLPPKNRRTTVIKSTKTCVGFPKFEGGQALAHFTKYDNGKADIFIDIDGVDAARLEHMVDFVMMKFREK